MHAEEVKTLLEQKIEGAQVSVNGEGCDFRVTVISDQFEGKRAVQRQQMIYAHLNSLISSGAIHAVTMITMTPNEYNQQH